MSGQIPTIEEPNDIFIIPEQGVLWPELTPIIKSETEKNNTFYIEITGNVSEVEHPSIYTKEQKAPVIQIIKSLCQVHDEVPEIAFNYLAKMVKSYAYEAECRKLQRKYPQYPNNRHKPFESFQIDEDRDIVLGVWAEEEPQIGCYDSSEILKPHGYIWNLTTPYERRAEAILTLKRILSKEKPRGYSLAQEIDINEYNYARLSLQEGSSRYIINLQSHLQSPMMI